MMDKNHLIIKKDYKSKRRDTIGLIIVVLGLQRHKSSLRVCIVVKLLI